MCGIAGIFNRCAHQQPQPQQLVNMVAIMAHRGPDDFGYEVLPEHGIGFSHARLSIIDLNNQRARQPFKSDDQQLMLVHNGEFYDFQRIRADLTAQGTVFRSKSDTEIALHLYQRYGLAQMLPMLRGEFAFALYDAALDTLYLVRDRFGVKPLYYAQTESGLVFGSELKTLFAHPEVPREFSSTGLFHQLIQVMVPGSTAFQGIHQVPPGHVIKVTRAKGKLSISEEKYWDLEFPLAQSYHTDQVTEQDYIDGVRERLLEAVQLRLTADVPVGCYLSGGIDSCAILGLASAVSQKPIKAFTIGFNSKSYDETAIATEMAEATGADQQVMRLAGPELYDNFVTTLWHTERTIYNTLGVAKYLMSQQVQQSGYKVVLTGEGSDELFAGYPSFRQDMFKHGLAHLPDAEREAWQQQLASSNALFRGAMLALNEYRSSALDDKVGFTPSCLQPWLSCSEIALPLLAPHHRAQLADYDAGRAIADKLDGTMLNQRHPLDKAQYVWIKTMLEGQILTWGGDRVDMAHSMEARPAFLDHHLAEYAATIPPHLRIKDNREKYVLREAMKGLLPDTLYRREKFAFMAPPAHTDPQKLAAIRQLAEVYLTESAINAAGVLSYSDVEQLLQRYELGTTSNEEKVQLDAMVNHVLGVQILHQHFVATDVPKLAQQRAMELGWIA